MLSQAILIHVGSNEADGFCPEATTVGGQSLLGRLLRALAGGGIDKVVVVGPRDPHQILASAGEEPSAAVIWVEAPADTPDGLMLLCARPHVRGPSLCLTTGHLVSRDFIAAMHDASMATNDQTVLAVDFNQNRAPDVGGALPLALADDRVTAIGPDITGTTALSTGAIVTSPALFGELQRLDVPTIEGALRRLAAQGALRAHDIGSALWQRVADPGALLHGEWMLRLFGDDLTVAPPALGAHHEDPRRVLDHIRAVLAEKDARHYVLLNPGPVNTTARVKSALVHHDVCHRDGDYAEVLARIERKLKRVFRAGPEHTVLLLTGSGTAAMEAAISSCVPRQGGLLVIDNGAFGARLAEVAELHGIPTRRLIYPWGELPVVADVERALADDPSLAAVAMIHHETSIGVLNPVSEVGAVCRAHGRLLLVDTVSSLGGEDVNVSRDSVDVCFSSANKCLHAFSGVSFVCVHDRVWKRIENVPPRVYYLDLKRYRRYLRESGDTPFTPAVSNFFALDAALDEFLGEGLARRRQRYQRWNRRIRTRLGEFGCEPLTATGRESCTVTTAKLPPGVRFELLYTQLKERGFIIYNCKAHLRDRYFQIANMGDLSDEIIERFLDAFAESTLQLAGQVTRVSPLRLVQP